MGNKITKKIGRPVLGKEDSRILSVRVPASKYEHYKNVFYTLVKTDGKRRQPDGVPIVVCLTLDTFLEIVETKVGNSFYDDPFWKQLP